MCFRTNRARDNSLRHQRRSQSEGACAAGGVHGKSEFDGLGSPGDGYGSSADLAASRLFAGGDRTLRIQPAAGYGSQPGNHEIRTCNAPAGGAARRALSEPVPYFRGNGNGRRGQAQSHPQRGQFRNKGRARIPPKTATVSSPHWSIWRCGTTAATVRASSVSGTASLTAIPTPAWGTLEGGNFPALLGKLLNTGYESEK